MKNKSAITLLFCANIISGFAQGVTMIAIPWYFSNMLHEVSLFGIIYGFVTAATIFWGLYSGTLIDKYNRKKVFMATSLAGGIILLTSATTGYIYGNVPVFFAAIVFTATFLIYSIHYPNLYAFAQEVTDPKDYARITSYIEIQGQVTNMIAGALATVLLASEVGDKINFAGIEIHLPFPVRQWSLHEIFLMDGITYFMAVAIIFFIRFKPVASRHKESGTILERFITGMNFLRKYPLILIFGTMSFTVFVTIMITGYQVIPIYIDRWLERGADVYAASEIFFAAGAVTAGFMTTAIFRKTSTVIAIIILSVTAAMTYFIGVMHTNAHIFYFLYFLLGLTNAGCRIVRITHIFHLIPNYIIGRTGGVFGVINLLFRLMFIGIFTIPVFADGKNIIYTFIIMGLFILLSMIPLLIWFRQINDFKTPSYTNSP